MGGSHIFFVEDSLKQIKRVEHDFADMIDTVLSKKFTSLPTADESRFDLIKKTLRGWESHF